MQIIKIQKEDPDWTSAGYEVTLNGHVVAANVSHAVALGVAYDTADLLESRGELDFQIIKG
jgi:hypothetical protein